MSGHWGGHVIGLVVDLLRDFDRVVDLAAGATPGAFDIGMAKQELAGAKVRRGVQSRPSVARDHPSNAIGGRVALFGPSTFYQ